MAAIEMRWHPFRQGFMRKSEPSATLPVLSPEFIHRVGKGEFDPEIHDAVARVRSDVMLMRVATTAFKDRAMSELSSWDSCDYEEYRTRITKSLGVYNLGAELQGKTLPKIGPGLVYGWDSWEDLSQEIEAFKDSNPDFTAYLHLTLGRFAQVPSDFNEALTPFGILALQSKIVLP